MAVRKKIAYLTLEAAIDDSLHTYTGGLGVVAGSVLRAAFRRNLPMVGVSILWRQGYYDQTLGCNGMQVNYVNRDYSNILADTGCKISIPLNGDSIWLKAWELKPETFGTVPVFFLDADIEENDPQVRSFTQSIYNGGTEKRMTHEIIIGIGGVRMLEALGMQINLFHLNEGHTVLAAIELLHQEMAKGSDFYKALEIVKGKVVGTTHTPVCTGGESYPLDFKMKMGAFPGLNKQQVSELGGDPFNSTVAMLKMAKRLNAVSILHSETANRIWSWVNGRCPIIPITNGVDVPFWQMSEFRGEKTVEEIAAAKERYKKILLDLVNGSYGKNFRFDVPTIVWARRWAGYKRPWLIFRDNWKWLKDRLQGGQIQLIFAGRPHPDDWEMRNLWDIVWQESRRYANLVILPGYELKLMQLLRNGADIWLNTPRRPREACGTSFMSAMMNCTLVVSTKDGGTIEALNDGNSFLFGADCAWAEEWRQDNADFEDLKFCLESAACIFRENKARWYAMALAAKKTAEEYFSADRMMEGYAKKLYA